MEGRKIIPIEVVQGHGTSDPPPVVRSEEEDWRYNREALERANQEQDWFEALRLLVYLSNKEHPHTYRAMAQAAWLVLKIRAPVTQVTLIYYNLLVSLGPDHAASGAVASLANLLANHRTPEHPDRELARVQAQQMLRFAAEGAKIQGEEAFQSWVAEQGLNDPDRFFPVVMETLAALVEGDWWIDRPAIIAAMAAEEPSGNG